MNVLTKIGTDTLTLSGSTDNVSLAVTVNSGTVILAKASASGVHAIGGGPGLVINGGTAQLGGTGGDQIYDFAPVTITSGTFDTNDLSETFATLNLQGTGIGGRAPSTRPPPSRRSRPRAERLSPAPPQSASPRAPASFS